MSFLLFQEVLHFFNSEISLVGILMVHRARNWTQFIIVQLKNRLVLPKKYHLVLLNNCQAGALVQQDKLIETELVLPRLFVVSDDRTGPISNPGPVIIVAD